MSQVGDSACGSVPKGGENIYSLVSWLADCHCNLLFLQGPMCFPVFPKNNQITNYTIIYFPTCSALYKLCAEPVSSRTQLNVMSQRGLSTSLTPLPGW